MNHRAAIHVRLREIFSRVFKGTEGAPERKLEEACKAVDDEIMRSIRQTPHEVGFYNLVQQDFKDFLVNLERNQKVTAELLK